MVTKAIDLEKLAAAEAIEPIAEGEAVVTQMPHATSTALDLRVTMDAGDPRLAGLMLHGRYRVTITPIKE